MTEDDRRRPYVIDGSRLANASAIDWKHRTQRHLVEGLEYKQDVLVGGVQVGRGPGVAVESCPRCEHS